MAKRRQIYLIFRSGQLFASYLGKSRASREYELLEAADTEYRYAWSLFSIAATEEY